MVKKGYRDPPYHNWSHAFTVAHFTYLCIKNLVAGGIITYATSCPSHLSTHSRQLNSTVPYVRFDNGHSILYELCE